MKTALGTTKKKANTFDEHFRHLVKTSSDET